MKFNFFMSPKGERQIWWKNFVNDYHTNYTDQTYIFPQGTYINRHICMYVGT